MADTRDFAFCTCGHSGAMHDLRMFPHDTPLTRCPCMILECKCTSFTETKPPTRRDAGTKGVRMASDGCAQCSHARENHTAAGCEGCLTKCTGFVGWHSAPPPAETPDHGALRKVAEAARTSVTRTVRDAFFRTFDPPTVLALLDEITDLNSEAEEQHNSLNMMQEEDTKLRDEIATLRAERDEWADEGRIRGIELDEARRSYCEAAQQRNQAERERDAARGDYDCVSRSYEAVVRKVGEEHSENEALRARVAAAEGLAACLQKLRAVISGAGDHSLKWWRDDVLKDINDALAAFDPTAPAVKKPK